MSPPRDKTAPPSVVETGGPHLRDGGLIAPAPPDCTGRGNEMVKIKGMGVNPSQPPTRGSVRLAHCSLGFGLASGYLVRSKVSTLLITQSPCSG